MLGGGYRSGTCILVSGQSGTGKTTLASTFARSACENGDKVLFVSFEESSDSLLAGMRNVGIDLQPALRDGTLLIRSVMPESRGIEEHLYHKAKAIESFQPDHLVVDAISACKRIAGHQAAFDFIIRLTHLCRRKGITALLVNQINRTHEAGVISGIGISSVIDTVVTLQYKDVDSETIRLMQVRKSRGSRHSSRYHTYFISDGGLNIELA
jgi:circadian clock protein KaiC